MDSLNNSFSDEESLADMNAVMVDISYMQDDCNPIKKLSDTFEGCVKDDSSLKVYLRVRPVPNKQETTITVDSDTTIVTHAPDNSKRAAYTKLETRHYMFSKVFGTHSTQNEVFDQSTAPLMQRFLAGENCVLFAYGMTNAGKTHTIQGSALHPGILPRLVSALLDKVSKNEQWFLEMSMLEIYQETIYDLLAKKKSKLSIRDTGGKVEVNKLSIHPLASTEDAFKLMDIAAANRSKSSTFLNTGSSRSHAVYTLSLRRPDGQGTVQFQLVDLAGAERGNRTKATLTQQKEANNINTSLMQLWRCLQALKRKTSDLSSSQELIPFRESKLTHLLMPILSRAGVGGVAMITCVSPLGEDYDETVSILNNASIASKIREIEVGRVAGNGPTAQPVAQPATVASQPAAKAPGGISMEELKEYKDKGVKRKRQESVLVAPAPLPPAAGNLKRAGGKASLLSGVNHILQNIQNISGMAKGAAMGLHPGAGAAAAQTAVVSSAAAESKSDEWKDLEAHEKIHKEVEKLKAENARLRKEAIEREGVIRREVVEEMAPRLGELMQVIEEQRTYIYELEDSGRGNGGDGFVLRSCKKRRGEGQEEALKLALQEAEEEIERLKVEYEAELARVRAECEKLRGELGGQKVQKSPSRSPLSPINPNTSPKMVVLGAGEENSYPSKPLLTSHAYITSKPATSQGVVKSAGKLMGAGNGGTSPQRLRGAAGEGGSTTYFTRLRSHFAR
eukprot:gene26756-32331_t